MRYRFLREALEEYEDAVSYYEGARSGLGETFANVELDDRVSGDTIAVIAIFHCKRRPSYWKDRLRQFR